MDEKLAETVGPGEVSASTMKSGRRTEPGLSVSHDFGAVYQYICQPTSGGSLINASNNLDSFPRREEHRETRHLIENKPEMVEI